MNSPCRSQSVAALNSCSLSNDDAENFLLICELAAYLADNINLPYMPFIFQLLGRNMCLVCTIAICDGVTKMLIGMIFPEYQRECSLLETSARLLSAGVW